MNYDGGVVGSWRVDIGSALVVAREVVAVETVAIICVDDEQATGLPSVDITIVEGSGYSGYSCSNKCRESQPSSQNKCK